MEARIEALGVSMDTSVLGPGVGGSASAPALHAAGEVISLVDSPERVFDSKSQFLVDDASSTASTGVVQSSALALAQAFLTPHGAFGDGVGGHCGCARRAYSCS